MTISHNLLVILPPPPNSQDLLKGGRDERLLDGGVAARRFRLCLEGQPAGTPRGADGWGGRVRI